MKKMMEMRMKGGAKMPQQHGGAHSPFFGMGHGPVIHMRGMPLPPHLMHMM